MPVIKSAIKKARQDEQARKHNRVIRNDYRLAVKKFRKVATEGSSKKANDALAEAYSLIDRAAKRNVIHKKGANRRKSRLAALLSVDKSKKTISPKKLATQSTKVAK
jgi:small subunit ribosomal protein S20